MVELARTAKNLLVAITLLACGFPQTSLAAGALKDRWRPFRDAFPMHIQTIAASTRDRTGALVVIIAEPPPGPALSRYAYQQA